MKIVFLAVGKRHDAAIADAIEDYTKRLDRYVSEASWQIVPAAQGKTSAVETQRTESQALTAKLHPTDRVILLDERGQQFTSPQFADQLSEVQLHPPDRLVFVIGGAYGVSADLMRRAHTVWSLSKLVFPHQLVRVLVAEQLYRAYTIMRGEPYHHE